MFLEFESLQSNLCDKIFMKFIPCHSFRYLPDKLKEKISRSDTVCQIPMKDVLLNHLNGLLDVKHVFERISELSKSMANVVITLVASSGFDGSTG